MALPRNSQAAKHYRWSLGSGDYKEAVVTDIAASDRVSREEAARRFEEAKAQHERRAAGQITRGLRQNDAIQSLRWRVLCRCEAAHLRAAPAVGLVTIDDSLLLDFAIEYKKAARARFVPPNDWIEDRCIEHLHRTGLIFRGTNAMRITEAGLRYMADQLKRPTARDINSNLPPIR